jgi:hypothetical protein
MGTCNPGSRFEDIVVKAVGPRGYAAAYTHAQHIESVLSSGDIVSLQSFVELKQCP